MRLDYLTFCSAPSFINQRLQRKTCTAAVDTLLTLPPTSGNSQLLPLEPLTVTARAYTRGVTEVRKAQHCGTCLTYDLTPVEQSTFHLQDARYKINKHCLQDGKGPGSAPMCSNVYSHFFQSAIVAPSPSTHYPIWPKAFLAILMAKLSEKGLARQRQYRYRGNRV